MFELCSRCAAQLVIRGYSLCPLFLLGAMDALYLRSPWLQGRFRYHLTPGISDVAALAWQCGLTTEEHSVTTPDGYVLTLHRLGRKGCSSSSGPSVLLLHGLMQDGESFIVGGRSSLAATLVLERGCDVWLAHARGSKYSQRGVHSVSTDAFWGYCLDELVDDVPLLIDLVRQQQRHSGGSGDSSSRKIVCVGFSQGSALLSCALSKYPHLNHCLALLVCLGPAVRPGRLAPSFLVSLLQTRPWVVQLLCGRRGMFASTLLWQRVLSAQAFAALCSGAMRFLFKWNLSQISLARQAQLFEHIYSPISSRTITHWFKTVASKRLARFDGRSEYDLTKITCPVAVFAGGKDELVDSSALCELAAHVVLYHCEPQYEHLDLIWADNAPARIFRPLLQVLDLCTKDC